MKDWDNAYMEKGEIQTEVIKLVREAVPLFKKRKFKKILDIGFGTGRHAIFLTENGFNVYGIDISPAAKKITDQKSKEKN